MLQHKQSYIQHLKKSLPDLESNLPEGLLLDNLIDENLLSPFVLELPQPTLEKIKTFIDAFYTLRELPEYAQALKKKYNKEIIDPGNKSLFMSYDFHLAEDGNPKLIEINTNAAFLALGYYFYDLLKLPLGTDFKISDLKNDFIEELKLNGKSSASPKILIIDEDPFKQRLFAEFVTYQTLIKSFGWDCQIEDYRNVKNHQPDLVYNRWTDFYFDKLESKYLADTFKNKSICYSPNPYEYFLQADKQRLVDVNDDIFWAQIPLAENHKEIIKTAVPLTKLMSEFDSNELWNQRKRMFFKPTNSFGSKQTYRGGSISRKLYDELPKTEFLAQEYVAAPEKIFTTPEGTDSFKFDLRCYAYKNKLQLVIARIYKGQVTNLKTTYGGFAPIKWV